MKINEIFYSIQGEGCFAGKPAIFIRFSGCNLACPFCDTDFRSGMEMSIAQIIEHIREIGKACRFVVLTGGEPTLQVTEQFVDALQDAGYLVAMETNGTRPWPGNLDWVTVSPKDIFCGERAALCEDNPWADEIKVVYNGENGHLLAKYEDLASALYIQPCDTGNPAKNAEILKSAIEWLKDNPDWKLSLQTQKIINVK